MVNDDAGFGERPLNEDCKGLGSAAKSLIVTPQRTFGRIAPRGAAAGDVPGSRGGGSLTEFPLEQDAIGVG